MSNVTDRMGTEPIPSILFKMSLPAVIAMFVQAVYNMVDRLFVGMYVQNAEDALAGVGVGFPIFLILIGVGMLVGMGGSAIFSISLGAKQDERAEKVLGTSILTMIIVSVAVGALGYIFLPQILNAIGAAVPYETGRPAEIIQAERIFDFGMDYYQIILLGSPLMAIGFGINSFIRAEGNTFRAMINMLAGALTNILLDWIFLAFLGWGIEGAALATVISQGVTALLVMEHFLFDRSKVRFHWKNLLILPKEILSIFAIGSSGFLMQSAAAAMNGLLNNQIRTFGELANQGLNPEQLAQGSYVAAGLSAMGIIYPVGMMILMPIFGLNQGAQPILGYNFGAKKPERVRQTVLLSIVFSTGILVLGFLAFQWFAPQIIELFVQGEQEISPLLAEIGPAGLKTFYLMMPLLGVQIIGAGYFIALGKAVKSLTLTLSRQAFLIIALLIVPEVLGYMGIFWSAPIADGLAVIVTAIFFLSEIYKLGKNPSPQDHQPTAAEETQGREGYID